MMWDEGFGMSGGWFFGWIMMLVVIVLIVVGIVLLVRGLSGRRDQSAWGQSQGPAATGTGTKGALKGEPAVPRAGWRP